MGAYKRCHDADEICDPIQCFRTKDFFVLELLAHGVITQSKEVDVFVISWS
jgi:hypothetical protein